MFIIIIIIITSSLQVFLQIKTNVEINNECDVVGNYIFIISKYT